MKCFYCNKEIDIEFYDFVPFSERQAHNPKHCMACKKCYYRHIAYDTIIENEKRYVQRSKEHLDIARLITDWSELDGLENEKYKIRFRRFDGYESLAIRHIKETGWNDTVSIITVNHLSMDDTIRWLDLFGFKVLFGKRNCPRCGLPYQ